MFSSGGALLWRRCVLLLKLTNKCWVYGNGSNSGGRFENPRGGRETRGGGDGLEGPVANYPWFEHRDHLVTFKVRTVLEVLVYPKQNDKTKLVVVQRFLSSKEVKARASSFGCSSLEDVRLTYNEVGKVKVLRVLDMIEHDSRACIYGALVSVDTNDIFSNNEFLILDVGRKIISKDNGRI
ncbi:hypothetical protein Tco_0890989 [Tanacetum coccineum]|uniref:Uncharacterized protein n=1 Tax=Tanacetum coccineum TaxID=301880 RepID=A0ABQ5C3T8_9ASTR